MRIMVTVNCIQHPEEDLQSILIEEIEIAVAALNNGTSAGVDKGQPTALPE